MQKQKLYVRDSINSSLYFIGCRAIGQHVAAHIFDCSHSPLSYTFSCIMLLSIKIEASSKELNSALMQGLDKQTRIFQIGDRHRARWVIIAAFAGNPAHDLRANASV